MAFLCPARRKRSKVKIRGSRPLEAPLPGRITGSTSIDTLVRVGIEKEQGPRARMVVLHDFAPCVDDELAVKRGEEVHVLYQENDWMYVIADKGREGFIPYTYCLPVQRCAEDFVTPDNQQQQVHRQTNNNQGKNHRKSEKTSKQNTKPAYQFATITKSGKPLTRRSSKSLPDISDINNGTASKANNKRYPLDTSSNHKHIFEEEEDKTYGMSQKRESRSTQRRPRSASQDPTTRRPHSARSSQSQPTSPVRSYNYNTVKPLLTGSISNPNTPRAGSNPGTPRAVHNYINSSYSSTRSRNNRYSTSSDIMQHSWNPSSGQSLVNQLSNTNLSSSYPANSTQLNRHSASYQHSPSSQVSQTLSYNSTGYNKSPSRDNTSHILNNSSLRLQHQQSHVETFQKAAKGEYIVLFSFSPHQENDISVEKGEFVTVLNMDDTDWFWVRRSDNQEGFVPGNYVMKIQPHNNGSVQQSTTNTSVLNNPRHNNIPASNNTSVLTTTAASNHHSFMLPVAAATSTSRINSSSSHLHSNNTNTVQRTSTHNNNQYHHGNNGFTTNPFVNSTDSNHQVHNLQTSLSTSSNNNQQQPFHNHHQQQQKYSTNQRQPELTANHQPQKASHLQQQYINNHQQPKYTSSHQVQANGGINDHRQLAYDNSGTTRIMCLYNYTAQVEDDLTVTQGEWLYANMAHSDKDWLWVYSPTQDKAGYVPRTYTKAPSNREYFA